MTRWSGRAHQGWRVVTHEAVDAQGVGSLDGLHPGRGPRPDGDPRVVKCRDRGRSQLRVVDLDDGCADATRLLDEILVGERTPLRQPVGCQLQPRMARRRSGQGVVIE